MSIYQMTIPTFSQMLAALSGWLEKVESHDDGSSVQALMDARLAPDMFPLRVQVRFVCMQARQAVERLTGQPVSDTPEVGDIEEARALIADTLARMEAAEAEQLDAGADRRIELSLPNGMTFDLDGFQYLRDWALPQFYFHLVTAYDILRHRGVALGKPNYVRHMFGYLRQPPAAS
jgi:hypothetical protein